MDNSFALGQSEHDRIYNDVIEPASFLGTTPEEKPKVIFIGGQPGAGKSAVVELSIREFNGGNVVSVNTDDLRAYHPQFDDIAALDDRRSAERTHSDASAWNQKLLSRCMETRRNIVLEGVFKDGQKLTAAIELFNKNGYEVIVRIIAAHERFSVWGINRRYEKEKVVRGHGRYVPIEYHDECYQRLVNSTSLIEDQKIANRIEVFNRDGQCVYANELAGASWKHDAGAKRALIAERDRKLSEKERRQYEESWAAVFEYLDKRKAPASEIAKVRKLAEKFAKD